MQKSQGSPPFNRRDYAVDINSALDENDALALKRSAQLANTGIRSRAVILKIKDRSPVDARSFRQIIERPA